MYLLSIDSTTTPSSIADARGSSPPSRLSPGAITDDHPMGRYNEIMNASPAHDDSPLFCARCGLTLAPGSGDFYLVRIEALADPSPPRFSEEDLDRDPRTEIERLIERMKQLSEQELADQVYRRLILHLCGPCYRRWIEDPVK